MMANGKVFSPTRCVICSVAMAILGVTWGCGGGIPSEAKLDPAAEARVQEAQDSQKKSREKYETKGPGRKTRLSKGDL